jgi:phage tail tape-measure protein
MNSSGIKRGLATTAVSALAVAGIPFIASSASAAAGDSITVASVGPIRNAGALGGEVLLKTKGVDEANLKLKGTNLTSGPNSPSQTVSIVSRSIVLDGANGDSNKTDGLDEITLNLAVTTPSAGDSFAVAVYEDEAGGTADTVDAGEARATISGATAGAPASIAISPDSQTTSAGVPTGNYTAAIADSAGNATQLTTGEGFALGDRRDLHPGQHARPG